MNNNEENQVLSSMLDKDNVAYIFIVGNVIFELVKNANNQYMLSVAGREEMVAIKLKAPTGQIGFVPIFTTINEYVLEDWEGTSIRQKELDNFQTMLGITKGDIEQYGLYAKIDTVDNNLLKDSGLNAVMDLNQVLRNVDGKQDKQLLIYDAVKL
jgi:hypothetical protein